MTRQESTQFKQPSPERLVMQQTWKNILFIHWIVAPEIIQNHLPPGLKVDTFNGNAYIGLVPFEMEDVRLANTQPFPGTSRFLELNLRTYVISECGTSGVWFFSLDAQNLLAVMTARILFQLPYYWAKMNTHSRVTDSKTVTYTSIRKSKYLLNNSKNSLTEVVYREPSSTSHFFSARQGTLEFFLVERYILFSWDEENRQLYKGRVSHHPYHIHEAELLKLDSTIFDEDKIPQPNSKPVSILYSPGVKTDIYQLNPLL